MTVQQRVAEHLGDRTHAWAVNTGLRRAAARLTPVRRGLHALVAAAYAGLPAASAADAVQLLRELPFPRAEAYGIQPELRVDYCASPYPTLPWKNDWTTNQGRSKGLVMPPFYELNPGNYVWKDAPYTAGRASGPSTVRHHSADYLIAYWMARKAGLITPTD